MKKGGRVRTQIPRPGYYQPVCYDKGSKPGSKGHYHPGEIHKKQADNSKR